MNYIGSKYSLITFIQNSIAKTLRNNGEKRDSSQMVFADIFAGTGVVSSAFKKKGYTIIANDIQYYSYILTKHLIENNGNLDPGRCEELINELNNLQGIEGFIYNNYSYEGTINQTFKRMYFTANNAKKCDAIRTTIEVKFKNNEINENEYVFLIGSLLKSIDKYANTTSVYGAYLKQIKKSAAREMVLSPLPIVHGQVSCSVYNEDSMVLIKKISGDILYLDPPYNERQYCTNYHMLETIAKYDNPIIKGKTGLRQYEEQKSVFCEKRKVENALDELIANAKFKYIFLSYNQDGLMSLETIKKIMEKYGKYKIFRKQYRRYKADNSRENKSEYTIEYLHCLVKE